MNLGEDFRAECERCDDVAVGDAGAVIVETCDDAAQKIGQVLGLGLTERLLQSETA